MQSTEKRKHSARCTKAWHNLAFAVSLATGLIPPTASASESYNPPLRLPPFKAGESISYSYQSEVHNATGGSAFTGSTLTETFDIKVLQVAPRGATIIWTLRTETGSGDYSRGERAYAAFKDVPIEVEIDPSGIPQDIQNLDVLKSHLFESALDDSARVQMQNGGPEFQKAEISSLFSRILVTISAMQPREPIAFGHTVLDTPVDPIPVGPKISATRSIDLLAVDLTKCSARVARNTTRTIQFKGKTELPSVLETTATVSTIDGWVIALHETLDNPPGSPKQPTFAGRLRLPAKQRPLGSGS